MPGTVKIMSELGNLAESGAIEILKKTIHVLAERGWSKGVTRDLLTGEVDLLGAVAIASGAPISQVDDRPDILSDSVPVGRRAAAQVAWEALEWACDGDPVEWQDSYSVKMSDVVAAIRKAIDRLSIAIR